jgi:hypothetical protein
LGLLLTLHGHALLLSLEGLLLCTTLLQCQCTCTNANGGCRQR